MTKRPSFSARASLLLGAVLIGAVFLFPIFYMLLTSVKPNSILLDQPPRYLFPPTFANYLELFVKNDFGKYYYNSTIVSFVSTVLSVILGSMVAFAFAKFRLRAKKPMFLGILMTQAFPPLTTIIPIFFVIRMTGMTDRLSTLIIFETAVRIPLIIWIMHGFFRTVPDEILEAGLVDGTSHFQGFARLAMPLATPGIVAVAILSFLYTWNSFLAALVFTTYNAITAPVEILSFMIDEQQINWGILSAGGIVTLLPIIVFTIVLHRYLLRGLTAGAIK